MNITSSNVNAVLDSPDPEQVLPRLFAKLLDLKQDNNFLINYTGALKSRFRSEIIPGEVVSGFSPFGMACLKAGIVKTMLSIAKRKPKVLSSDPQFAIYHALDSLLYMIQTGTLKQRTLMLEELLRYDVVNICIENLDSGLCIQRILGVSMLHVLATESSLGEKITPSMAADIIVATCNFTLVGPSKAAQEMESHDTRWQSQIIMGSQGIDNQRASRYVRRHYAKTQDNALAAIHGLFCTSPPPNRQFCLDILKKRPEVLDLLFDCAIMERPAWCPEMRVDSTACEVLSLLFHYPLHIIPGVSMSPVMDAAFKAQEWKAMGQALSILTSRTEWAAKIIDIWEKVEEEDLDGIRRLINRVGYDYATHKPVGEEEYREIFSCRGTSRISVLRLIATITHAAERCSLSNVEIESFLRIAYEGSHKIKGELGYRTEKDTYIAIQRSKEIFGNPAYTKSTGTTVDAPLHIAGEAVLGPIALARLLVVLAQRNVFDTIQVMKKKPKDLSPTTSLQHLQQITHPDVIARFLGIAVQRMKDCMENGRKSLDDPDKARFAFADAAELAAALVTFDDHTQGKYSAILHGVRKELVITLGNASEMALRRTQNQIAYHLGQAAVTAGERVPASEDLPAKVKDKNTRRLQKAQEGLPGKQ